MRQETEDLNAIISAGVRFLMSARAEIAGTQGKLAKLSGVSQATICMNLRGLRGWTADVLEKISLAYCILPEQLIALGRRVKDRPDAVKRETLRIRQAKLLAELVAVNKQLAEI